MSDLLTILAWCGGGVFALWIVGRMVVASRNGTAELDRVFLRQGVSLKERLGCGLLLLYVAVIGFVAIFTFATGG